MDVTANGTTIPVIQTISRIDLVNEVQREILEVQTDTPMTEEHIAALIGDKDWKQFYTEPVRYSVWLAKVNPTEAQVETLIQERAALMAERDKLVKALPSLLEGKTGEIVSQFQAYLPEVKMEEPIAREL